jgi:hypothetical protein
MHSVKTSSTPFLMYTTIVTFLFLSQRPGNCWHFLFKHVSKMYSSSTTGKENRKGDNGKEHILIRFLMFSCYYTNLSYI